MEDKLVDKLMADIKEYIESSQDTNDYCERTIICEALLCLERDPPDILEAKRRLHQVIDSGSGFVDRPSWAK